MSSDENGRLIEPRVRIGQVHRKVADLERREAGAGACTPEVEEGPWDLSPRLPAPDCSITPRIW
jgi:hypothetical protein